MPVFNEASTLPNIVELVLAQPSVLELVIVDDCSTDDSGVIIEQLAKDSRVKAVRHSVNAGKGAAIRTGIVNTSGALVLIQDADLEYDPSDYDKLIKPILNNKGDVVFGSRFLGGGEHRVLYYWHSVGNRILTELSNMATGLNLTDMETCYKVFRRDVLERLCIEEDRFGMEPEITAKVAKLGVRVYEVPISYYGRTYSEGKKVNWRDGISALRCIVKYNFF